MQPTSTAVPTALSPDVPPLPPPAVIVQKHGYSIGRYIGMGIISIALGFVLTRILLPVTRDLPHILGIKREYIFYQWNYISPTLFIQRKNEQIDNFRMKTFHLTSRDYVRSLPPVLFIIPTLEDIYTNNNPIRAIPDSVSNASNLRSLYILNGNLTAVPANVGDLANLEELVLVGNHIKRLPDNIGNLTNLKILNLAYNDLETLPASIVNMEHLEIIDITGNRFREFPRELPPNLGFLFIGGNKIPADTLLNKTVPNLNDIIY